MFGRQPFPFEMIIFQGGHVHIFRRLGGILRMKCCEDWWFGSPALRPGMLDPLDPLDPQQRSPLDPGSNPWSTQESSTAVCMRRSGRRPVSLARSTY